MSSKPLLLLTWAACCAAMLAACAPVNLNEGPEEGFTSRMVTVLNRLSESGKSRVMEEMGQTAGRRLVFSRTSGSVWSASVTQSSRNRARGQGRLVRRRIRENRIIDARYEGAHLVFDYRNPASRVRGTTARMPAAPGYRVAVASVPSVAGWKGVEYFVINRARGWYYSVLLSDIRDNDDYDYMALGVWFWLGDLDNPGDLRKPHVTAVASGSDPFETRNRDALKGQVTYEGYAAGVYAAKEGTPTFRYFKADVRLTADFDGKRVWGVIVNGADTSTGEALFGKMELKSSPMRPGIRMPATTLFQSRLDGTVDGVSLAGNWGGRFFGNGDLPTDLPTSVGGTFGAGSAGDAKVTFIGSIAAYRAEAGRRKNLAPYVVSR